MITPDRWPRIEPLLERALELPPADRRAYLMDACAGDAALFREVWRLASASEAARESFLQRPAVELAAGLLGESGDPMPDATRPDAIPEALRQVGSWRTVRLLGRGGMGSVYLAERADGRFRQRVALKVVKRGMDTRAILDRFRSERRILAGLEHPNIARLLDGGATDDGRPYFAMEYVDGLPLDRYCDERGLDVEARIRLFTDACAAVQHAHAKLVVHRDLKPSNILVTADGQVKLLDFGIAKVLDETGSGAEATLTTAGVRALTPEYAAPEHLRGEPVTTAADVYSLGVVLYRLLTGTPPFRLDSRSPEAAARVLAETDPVPPSRARDRAAGEGAELRRRARRLRGDLDAVALTALRHDPDRRYPSVEAFSRDLRRHLENLPVRARPDSPAYRASRFVRRHRIGVAATAVVFLTVMGSAAAVSLQQAETARERDRARLEAEKTRSVVEFLTGIFSVSDPRVGQGANVTARELLERGTARIDSGLTDQPEVRGAMLEAIGDAYFGLGLYERARGLLEARLALERRLHGDAHPHLDVALGRLADLFRMQGDFEAAEPLYRQSLAMSRRLFGDRHASVVVSLNGLGFLLRGRGEYAEAERLYREAIATGRVVWPEGHRAIPISLNGLGAVLWGRGEYREAESYFREAVEIGRSLLGEAHPDLNIYRHNLALTLHELGDVEAAASLYREVVAAQRAVSGDRHPLVAMTLGGLAALLRETGDPAGAETLYREAQEIQRATLSPRSERLATTLVGLGWSLLGQDRAREAEPLLRAALSIREERLVEDHWKVAEARSVLGACLSMLGRHAEAEPLLVGAYRQLRAAYSDSHPRTRRALEELNRHRERPQGAGARQPSRGFLLAPSPLVDRDSVAGGTWVT